MCEKSLLELYTERTKRLEAQGVVLLSFNCPSVVCRQELKAENVEPGVFYTPLSTCPHCEQIYWKLVQHTRARGLVAFRHVSTVLTSTSLAMQPPASCSQLYRAGWTYADGYTIHGGDLSAESTHKWPEDKANGFWDRIAAQRVGQTAT